MGIVFRFEYRGEVEEVVASNYQVALERAVEDFAPLRVDEIHLQSVRCAGCDGSLTVQVRKILQRGYGHELLP